MRARAARWPEYSSLVDLSSETLRGIASKQGIDFATAVLYDRAAASHAEFIARIDRMRTASNRVNATVAIVPAKAPAAFRNVRAWLNVCGTLGGSPVAAWLVSRKLSFLAAWLFFKCSGHNFEFLRELAPSSRGPLASPLRIPNSMSLISVVGFPLRRHLTNSFMRACHSRIAPLGPNDGGVLLADVCQLPGSLYPVWGSDHYLRPESRGRSLLGAVLEYLKEEMQLATPAQRVAVGAGV